MNILTLSKFINVDLEFGQFVVNKVIKLDCPLMEGFWNYIYVGYSRK